MGRWEPDAAGRLRAAAIELFVERGYEQTTVADIAERAGVTARTFFRHHADKREVLFAGAATLQTRMLDALRAAPVDATPLEAVAAAVAVSVDLVGTDREWSRRRQEVIGSTAELRERELSKLDTLAAALTEGLRERGVAEPEAVLAAETGVMVFRLGFARWAAAADGDADVDLRDVLRDLFDRLRVVTGSGSAGPG